MGLRNAIDRIRDSRSGATTDPLALGRALCEIEDEQARQDAFVADTFGDEPEDTDPGGADLTDPAAIPPGAHRTTQTKYGVGLRHCPVPGCGTPTTGIVCATCTAAGRLPDDMDGFVAPGMERILPDPPPGYPRSTFLTEAILDGEEETTHACPPRDSNVTPCCGRTPFQLPRLDRMTLDPALVTCDDLPTLDECGPDATVAVLYPGGDAA